MKTLNLLFAFIFLASLSFAQQVPRDKVLVEIGTGTWCYYCPGAALGAEDLIANGKDVAVVEYHGPAGQDPYATSESVARNSYYGLTGYPTAWFDGGNAVVGGNHTTSMYGTYLGVYNQAIDVTSPFSIELEGHSLANNMYEVAVIINKVAANSSANLTLHLAVTESDILMNWQGLTDLNFVERMMIPNQGGTHIEFSTENVVYLTKTFTVDPGWVADNCEFIAFLQDSQTKQVFQTTMKSFTDFGTASDYDASLTQIAAPKTVCDNTFAPKVKLTNYGLNALTSLDIVYQVNGGTSMTQPWTGNLAYMESTIVDLPEVSFTIQSSNDIMTTLQNPDGMPDEFPSNDIKIFNIGEAMNVSSPVSLALKLDDNPQETSWEIKNSMGDVLYSGGPYTQPNQFVVQTFDLTDDDCYSFFIYDDGGDGLTGLGMYKLAYNGSLIFAQGNGFGIQDQVEFGIGLVGIGQVAANGELSVYPSPVENTATISFDHKSAGPVILKVYNTLGAVVLTQNYPALPTGTQYLSFNSKDLNAGIYYFNMETGNGIATKKVVISK